MGPLWSCRGSETARVAILLYEPVLHWRKERDKMGTPEALVKEIGSSFIFTWQQSGYRRMPSTLSLVEQCGQKHGHPPTPKGLFLCIFLHPQPGVGGNLRPLHTKLSKGLLLSKMSLSARQKRKETRGQLPKLSLSSSLTQPTSVEGKGQTVR